MDAKSLKITRKFKVAPEKVFDAFTHPSAMRVWWTENTHFDMDVKVGGFYTITRKEEDATYVMKGEFLEVQKPHRLQYTVAMPDFSPNEDVISIDIQADGQEGSVMTFTQEGPDIRSELEALQAGVASESEKGWQMGFDLMEEAWKAEDDAGL